ncbi:protein CASC1-like isoform X1 [Hyposmocoma kahamanoa]|nr:protein CASC1-like isoform X1 [Hyposmocoma kahamanoa]XP_026322717.1 protein CASC1-like isoform X1 [Hyposmocoma kahamanoa]
MAQDLEEQDIRRDILDKTCVLFERFEKQKIADDNKKQKEAEWQQYLRCDGLPDPRVVTQVATYLHRYKETAKYDVDELETKCVEILPMIEMLEVFVANARQYTEQQVANYNEIRLQLREQLATAIEFASYFVLRDLQKNLQFDSVKIAHYNRTFQALKLNIWVAIKLPTRKKKPPDQEPEPQPVDLAFPAIQVSVTLPKTIEGSNLSVRASRSEIDLLSERTRSFPLLHDLPNRYEDLFIFNVKELEDVQKLKKEQDVIRNAFYKGIRERTRELENMIKVNPFAKWDKEKDELDQLQLAEPPPLPDPRTHLGVLNEKAFQKYLRSCMCRHRGGEVNMRKYRICGGVLNMDLLVTPPQPKPLEYEVVLTTLILPKELKALDYKVQYRTPPPPSPGTTRTPEEIEAEMKKIETEYEKLAIVHIELPQEIMWTEPPVVCQWQEQRRLWTTNYINDYKYNEDKFTIQFRTGVLWPIGIGTLRYNNMPFQGWELKPDPNSKGVLVVVTGVCVTVTWLCVGNKVKLKFIANATTNALKEHFNKKYTVKRMVQIMRGAAVDLFPEFDGHTYVEGSCPKEWAMERHLYHAMAFLSRSYNFQWSRWNVQGGWRNIIIQFREAVDTKREGKLMLLQVTPQRVLLLKNNEMSMNELDMEPVAGLPFFPDLFTMNMSYGSVDARRTTFGMHYKLVETVFDLLQECKLCSFS